MSLEFRSEVRLLWLVTAIVGAYGLAVAWLAWWTATPVFARGAPKAPIGAFWFAVIAIVLAAYALDLAFRRKSARPLSTMLDDLRKQMNQPAALIARVSILVSWSTLLLFVAPFKNLIPHLRAYSLDPWLASADRSLFLGNDPWVLTHAAFGGVVGTAILQTLYNLWFGLLFLALIYLILRPELTAARARIAIAFPLCWMVIGSLAAVLLPSVGPCYYERLLGLQDFAPLMARLLALDGELVDAGYRLGVHALAVQNDLWMLQERQLPFFGSGISAMPSMHVSMAVLLACAAAHINRTLAALLTANAVGIWIGSVHLGWHYALDGIVAAPLTLALWHLSSRICDRWIFAEQTGETADAGGALATPVALAP